MPRELSDPLTDEDKAWMRARNLPIPGEDDEAGVAQAIQQPDENDPGDDESDDYNDWKNATLRNELSNRDLPTSGNKADLVARLQEDDAKEK
jgi:hypothetical protein